MSDEEDDDDEETIEHELTQTEERRLHTFKENVQNLLKQPDRHNNVYDLKINNTTKIVITRKKQKANCNVDISVIIGKQQVSIKNKEPQYINATIDEYFKQPTGSTPNPVRSPSYGRISSSVDYRGTRSARKSPSQVASGPGILSSSLNHLRRVSHSDVVAPDTDDDNHLIIDNDDDDDGADDFPPALSLNFSAAQATDESAQATDDAAQATDDAAQATVESAQAADSGDSGSAQTVELTAGVLNILQRLYEAKDTTRKKKRKFDEICENNPKKTDFEICMLFAEEVKKMKTPSDAQVKTFHGFIVEINALEEKYCEAKNKLIEAIRNAREVLEELE